MPSVPWRLAHFKCAAAQHVCMHHGQSACMLTMQLSAAVMQAAGACCASATELHAVPLCICTDGPPAHQYNLSSAGPYAWLKYTCRTKPKQGAGPNLPAPPAVKSRESMHISTFVNQRESRVSCKTTHTPASAGHNTPPVALNTIVHTCTHTKTTHAAPASQHAQRQQHASMQRWYAQNDESHSQGA
jgi:hypothetical protein